MATPRRASVIFVLSDRRMRIDGVVFGAFVGRPPRVARALTVGVWLVVTLAIVLPAGGAANDGLHGAHASGVETALGPPTVFHRIDHWAEKLQPLEMVSLATHESAEVRLYTDDGNLDETAQQTFERIAAGADPPHPLSPRLEQLVVKAAYHFKDASILVVSSFRANAGRHGTGEAIDFKLRGVRSAVVASYLRELPRAGVGIYTHPRTQFVHLDVRDSSYHWLDASPPNVRWAVARLRDPSASKRDASWVPEMDLPL
jgi:uncharacterized protein YcbK (DUF882 family)